MLELPEWAPNVHPIIVHFPVALLPLAALIDLLAVFVRKRVEIHATAVSVYVLGAIGVLAAYLSGESAADGFDLPSRLIPPVTDHADAAELTLWFFGVYALIRVGYYWWSVGREGAPRVWMHAVLFIVGAGGLALLVRTGDLGARLVFEYGLGVQALERHADEPGEEFQLGEEARLQVDENGSWRLIPGANAGDLFAAGLTFVEGGAEDLAVRFSEEDSSLALHATGGPVLFTAGGPIESVEVRAALRLDEFEGSVRLVHHVQDAHNYHFLEAREGRIRQGADEAGSETVFDESAVALPRWINLRAVADRTHFRGYLGDELVTHPHASAPAAGPAGLRLEGRGTLYLRSLRASPLR